MLVRLLLIGVASCLLPVAAIAGAGNIDVYVYDLKTGAEVRNYTARLVGTGGLNREVTVGNTNYVRFSNVPTDQLYTLTVSRSGYHSRSIFRIVVSHNNTRSFNLSLTPTTGVTTFTISGRVVDAVTNQPLANAYVEGYREVSGSSARRMYAITDAQGRFTIEHCIPGAYWIFASRVGYYNSPSLYIYANAAVGDVVLPCAPHGVALTDWRLDQFYDALNGVNLRSGEFLLQSDAGWTIRGNFWTGIELDRLPAWQTYNITVRYVNTDRAYYPSTRVGFQFTAGIVDYTYHYLVPSDVQVATLSGVVRNMVDGSPVPNALVLVRYGSRPLQSMYTDSQGRYSFSNLPRELNGLVIEVSKPGWITYSWGIPPLTASSESNDIFIRPRGTPGGGLDLYVYDEASNTPLNNSTLQIALPTGQSMRIALGSGDYTRISGLYVWQAYDLTVTLPGYRATTYLSQLVPYDTWRSIRFDMLRASQSVGSIMGTVRDLITGNPIPNALVSAYSSVRTNSQGRYTLSNQPIGTYNLTVSAAGYNSRTVQVRVSSGDSTMDFFLVPSEYLAGRVYGYVRDATTSLEIANSTVVAVAPNGLTLTFNTAPDSGYYNFPDLPYDRPFTFVGSAAGYNSAQVSNFWVRQGDTHQIDLSLQPSWGGLRMGRRLQGRVLLDGYLGDAEQVWLAVEAYQHGALVWRQDVRLNADGSYEVHCPLNATADLRLKADRWLSVWLQGVDLGATTELPAVRFSLIGDTNDDNRIDDADLMEILFRFGQKEPNAPDLNGDGYVDDADLMLVLFHFGASGR
ncbi:MAG: carboxypeptidase regulatory-like domain-containing protein [Fimbriimonadales bacterium]|nr:carboxypeptidase regulatory-like domain-containing protein [Fimbriimonadales bacterium]